MQKYTSINSTFKENIYKCTDPAVMGTTIKTISDEI